MTQMRAVILSVLLAAGLTLHCGGGGPSVSATGARWDPFLDTLQLRTLRYFLHTTDSATGLSPDRWPSRSPSSIAAVGFALTSLPVAVERGAATRAEAADRVRRTLTFLRKLPQHGGSIGSAGTRGLFYHFIGMQDGLRAWNCELSTIDTGLLMAGILFCQSYFDRPDPLEREIRELADTLYRRVDWAWATDGSPGIRLGWTPEKGFMADTWTGYDESMILTLLALGSPTHPVTPEAWNHYTRTYLWASYQGEEFVSFGPLFGHQYSHCWIDFRGIRDSTMRLRGIDYFENSRRATASQRKYAIRNPAGFAGYSDSLWGLTACDGPGDVHLTIEGRERRFQSYAARGVSVDWVNDDGTIAPTAAGASVAFLPELCIPALKGMRNRFGSRLFREFGFADAFNMTYVTPSTPDGWIDPDHLGIDQGPIALMIENLRTGFVWEVMKRNPYIRRGLKRAGFTGGWLDEPAPERPQPGTLLDPARGGGSSILLDDFTTLDGWHPILSDGAEGTLRSGEGKEGGSLVIDFDLSRSAGYVIAEKAFQLDLPPNYEFTFDLRAETPVNNFEFKLIDEHDNVHWIKKLNVEYPATWTRQRIKKRHLQFAWGPAPGKELRRVRALQFVVSAGTGGKGKIWIDNFRFASLEDGGDSSASGRQSRFPAWRTSIDTDSLVVDLRRRREIGGLLIDWDSVHFPRAYEVLLSDDGTEWQNQYAVRQGKPGRAIIPLGESEGRYIKLRLRATSRGEGAAMAMMGVEDAAFAPSPNTLFRTIAAGAPRGRFPRALLGEQTYWTVFGVNGDVREGLMNEEGQIETDRAGYSLEPFLFVNGRLVTWSDITTTPALAGGSLPIPSVTWRYLDHWRLTIQGVAAGSPGSSALGVRYSVRSEKKPVRGKLFVAVRPFQVNPPTQFLNIEGGTARIDSISYRGGDVTVNGTTVTSLTTPSGFGAAEFDQGDITDFLARGELPPAVSVNDHFRHASGALAYNLNLPKGQTAEVSLALPSIGWKGDAGALRFGVMRRKAGEAWERDLGGVRFHLPPAAGDVANTIRSTLAYILINRDGPGIQPGSRSYERSWIRDGSLTCAALLRLGHQKEVREFIDWYARGQFASGKIPCVIDSRGPDPVPENDSHGEFIYAVRQYFLFSRDTAWLRAKLPAVAGAVRYIQSLRAERKKEMYRTGTPAQRALYGLVPESISHEGYSDVPRHSYWDDFFTLRGLKDAAAIAVTLREEGLGREWGTERDDFQKDLHASIRLAIANARIDYIPGCAELGDFDATSTTVGLDPAGELGRLPEPELHNTFERYFTYFRNRRTDTTVINYTPYEARIIGSFVRLGQKERARELLEFLISDRRPAAWNHWAEVVWRNPRMAKFIGDMPHTWVGSDFLRSVLAMFCYERDSDGAHLLASGIPDQWIQGPRGVGVENLPTIHGLISYTLKGRGRQVTAEITGNFDARNHPLILASPLRGTLRGAKVNGRITPLTEGGEIVLASLPARVMLEYR